MNDNDPPQRGQKRPSEGTALCLPPRRKAGPPDNWRLKGRHIGRTIHIFANIGQLILSGIQIDKDLALLPPGGIEKLPAETRLQYQIYTEVLRALPDLEEGLEKQTIGTEELNIIATRIQAGMSGARSDDNRGVKQAMITWITDPVKGLVPPIDPKVMTGRGWNHEVTGKELCPAGLDWNDPSIKKSLKDGSMIPSPDMWPICFYLNGDYDPDRPWSGLLRGRLIVNAFKHVFTSPTSVGSSSRATKGSNSFVNGMSSATVASIAYVATLVCFALGSQPIFSREDTVTDSQSFFNILLAFLTHPHERENTNELIAWWNEQVFPHAIAVRRAPTASSPLARCVIAREKRLALQGITANTTSG